MHDVDLPLESSTLLSGSYPDGSGSVVRSGEDDGAVSVEQHPMLGVPAHRLRQHPALDVLPLGLQHGHRVLVPGPRHVLLDDRPLIQVGGHVVGGRADQLDAAIVGLRVGARALEGGQERVVNIDDAALHGAADLVGEDLHVAGQDDELHVFGGDEVEELALRLGLRVLRDGDVEEGDAVELGDGRQVRVVADDRDDVDGQALRLGAVQEVSEAVALARHHDDGAQLTAQVIDAVGGAEFFGDASQALVDRGAALRGVDLNAHKERARVGVAELLGLDDIAAGLADHARDGMHDAGAVRAGQGHNKLRVFSHRGQSSQVHTHERGRGTVCGRCHGVAGRGYRSQGGGYVVAGRDHDSFTRVSRAARASTPPCTCAYACCGASASASGPVSRAFHE